MGYTHERAYKDRNDSEVEQRVGSFLVFGLLEDVAVKVEERNAKEHSAYDQHCDFRWEDEGRILVLRYVTCAREKWLKIFH